MFHVFVEIEKTLFQGHCQMLRCSRFRHVHVFVPYFSVCGFEATHANISSEASPIMYIHQITTQRRRVMRVSLLSKISHIHRKLNYVSERVNGEG